MIPLHRSRTVTERDLAALADGSLAASRRIPVERAVAGSLQLQAAVAAQRRALGAVDRMLDEPAPAALRARLSLAQPPSRRRAQLSLAQLPSRRRAPQRPFGLVIAAALAAAAAVAVVAVSVSGGSPRANPTVLQAALVTVRPPQARVGEARGASEVLPGVTGAGLSYPYWDDQFGYKAVGVRYDRVAGRAITTVYYARGSSRVAYEIVGGSPLKLGHAGRTTVRSGVLLGTLSGPHGAIVTWVRHGHTCVLTGANTGVPAMLRLAAWHEGGRVPY
jgi:anti-sigma factor RsiW